MQAWKDATAAFEEQASQEEAGENEYDDDDDEVDEVDPYPFGEGMLSLCCCRLRLFYSLRTVAATAVQEI